MSSLLKILKLKSVLVTALLLYASLPLHAETFPSDTKYEVCFTPGGDCTSMIVGEINKANKSVYLQAYSFTSKPIAQAITNAKRKGIDIKVILDKSQVKHNQYSSSKYLTDQHVPVWVDYRPAIAHNKVVIIDSNIVITGSFNFTKAAQEKNAENILIIHDAVLAKQYTQNLFKRQSMSLKLT